MNALNTQRRHASRFVQYAAPELIIEKMDLSRGADSDAGAGFRDRERTRRPVGWVGNLLRNFQDSLARGFVDPGPSVQRSIHRADGNVGYFRDEVNPAPVFLHAKRCL